jgi:hypothetical protein
MEIRDVLPVVGWNDKAFRALATLAVNVVDAPTTSPVELKARWRGRDVLYREDTGGVAVTAGRSQLYAWDKHQPWALWDGMALTDER